MLLIPIHAMGRGLKRRMRHSGSPVSMRLPHGPEVKGQALSRACSGRLRSIQGGVSPWRHGRRHRPEPTRRRNSVPTISRYAWCRNSTASDSRVNLVRAARIPRVKGFLQLIDSPVGLPM